MGSAIVVLSHDQVSILLSSCVSSFVVRMDAIRHLNIVLVLQPEPYGTGYTSGPQEPRSLEISAAAASSAGLASFCPER